MKLLYSALILSALMSCTLTKRVHNHGWHIEWRNSLNRTMPTSDEENNEDVSGIDPSVVSNEKDSISYSDDYNLKTTDIVASSSNEKEEKDSDMMGNEDPVRITLANETKEVQNNEMNTESVENEFQRQEPLGVVSIFFSSAAILLFIHICLLLTDNGWVALFGMSYPGLFLLAISLAVIALILAIYSLRKINKSPTTLKGRKLAWTGVGMSIGANGLILVLLIGIGLYFLFENFFGF